MSSGGLKLFKLKKRNLDPQKAGLHERVSKNNCVCLTLLYFTEESVKLLPTVLWEEVKGRSLPKGNTVFG